jgi:hypothetical protein
MLFDPLLPALFAGAGIKRMDPPILVTEYQRDAACIT